MASSGKRGSEKVTASFWLKSRTTHGGNPRPPRIIVNGIPFPDLVRREFHLGNVGEPAPTVIEDVAAERAAAGPRG